MSFIKRAWHGLIQSILDAALGATIRFRKTVLPPEPIVWRDPRPYRSWRLENLEREFEILQCRHEMAGLSGAEIEDVDFRRCLVLDEILTQRGLREDAPRNHGCN